jgi:glycosyltransferase involved in cell wall biosynthesis
MCNAHAGRHEVAVVIRRAHRLRGVSICDYLDASVTVLAAGRFWQQRAVAKAIEHFRPDVVHAHLRRGARLLSRINPKAATIATLHMWVNGPHFLQMDGLIVIAEWQKRDLGSYRGRVFSINESLEPHRRLTAPEITRLRADFGAGPADFLIGGVGRLAHSKGFDLLIQAYRAAGLERARLVLVGEGRERAHLEELAGGAVHFAGFRKDVKDCYQAFDLFVSPSRSEPLGRVVLEALDAGTPVLATMCQGPSEILGRYPGRLIPIGDVGALTEALQELSKQRPARVSCDLSPYHIDAVACATLSAYGTLVGLRERPARRR